MNPKQERFVAEYVKDLNATQAYMRAGYSPGGAAQAAEKLLRNAEVKAAIATLQAKIGARLEITAAKVLQDLEDARRNAMATMEWGPAIRAAELLGKHIGMFVERSQSDVTVHGAIDRPPDETREQWIQRRERELAGKPH